MRKTLLILATCALPLALSAPAFAESPKMFLKKAIEGDNSEITVGQLAQQRAQSQDVKNFAATLVQDHQQAKQQAVALAQQMGVTPTEQTTPEAKDMMRKLESLNGEAFDRQFVMGMVKDHKKDIREFQQEAKGKGEVAQLAAQTLPTLQKHLDIAERLQQQMHGG